MKIDEDKIIELLFELKSLITNGCEEFKNHKKNDIKYVNENFPKLMAINSELKMMSNMIVRVTNIG